MWVSRKEFDKLKEDHNNLNEVCIVTWDKLDNRIKGIDRVAFNARNDVDTLTKQMKCSCENYEVLDRPLHIIHSELHCGFTFERSRTVEDRFFKHCLDCGWTTTYDTEEGALADKQALLDKQIDALKEQKKSLKKK